MEERSPYLRSGKNASRTRAVWGHQSCREYRGVTGDDLDQALIIRKIEFDHSSPDDEKTSYTVLSTTTYKNVA